MLECKGSVLNFSFAEVHPEAKCSIEFIRTLRLPDDGKTYPLPPGLGSFPVRHTDDHKANLSEETVSRGGVLIPMYQSEALWVKFQGSYVSDRGGARYPMAVKIAAGKRSAVTGAEWTSALREKDYIVIPIQPWIDGFMLSEGVIRQFIAAPLGMGFTVEEQLTGKAEFGGIQLEVIPMKREEFDRRFPKQAETFGMRSLGGMRFEGAVTKGCAPAAAGMDARLGSNVRRRAVATSMGMAAGGRMKQDIHPDPYGLEVWDTNHKSRTFVHLMNSLAWQQVTGSAPPQAPLTAKDYNHHGLPWYEYYSEAGSLGGTSDTVKIKSVAELAEEKGFTILPENVSSDPAKIAVIKAPPHAVKDGIW